MAVVIKFTGGPRDGQQLRDDADHPHERDEAYGLYVLSNRGQIGHRLKGPSPAGVDELASLLENAERDADGILRLPREPAFSQTHRYEVVACDEIADDIIVRCRYCDSE